MSMTANGPADGPRKIFGRDNVAWAGPTAASDKSVGAGIMDVRFDVLYESDLVDVKELLVTDIEELEDILDSDDEDKNKQFYDRGSELHRALYQMGELDNDQSEDSHIMLYEFLRNSGDVDKADEFLSVMRSVSERDDYAKREAHDFTRDLVPRDISEVDHNTVRKLEGIVNEVESKTFSLGNLESEFSPSMGAREVSEAIASVGIEGVVFVDDNGVDSFQGEKTDGVDSVIRDGENKKMKRADGAVMEFSYQSRTDLHRSSTNDFSVTERAPGSSKVRPMLEMSMDGLDDSERFKDTLRSMVYWAHGVKRSADRSLYSWGPF